MTYRQIIFLCALCVVSAHANDSQLEYTENCVTLPEIDAISSQVSVLKKELENIEATLLNKRNSLRAAVMRTGKDKWNTVVSKGSDVKSWFKNKLSNIGTKPAKDGLGSGIEMQPWPPKNQPKGVDVQTSVPPVAPSQLSRI